MAQAEETGRFTTEAWRVRKDGTCFWAMVVIDAIREGDKLIGFAKITRDMTEQHNAHRAALASERRLRLLVQGVTDYAIYMLDPNGLVTNWNTGGVRIKGYSEEEVIGPQHFFSFLHPRRSRGAECRRRRLSTHRVMVATNRMGGAAARTARNSGPTRCSMPFAMTTAGS